MASQASEPEAESLTSRPSIKSIITSPILVFRVGADAVDMMLPKVLVSKYSQALDRLMNGGMSESVNGTAVLEDVDESTFFHFAEWLYREKYILYPSQNSGYEQSAFARTSWDAGLTPKEKRKREKEMKLNGTWEDRVVPDDVQWGPSSNWGEKRTKKQEAWRRFIQEGLIQESQYVPGPPPRKNNRSSHPDFTEIFLGHAKLYNFADKWGISPLSELCLENLKTSLIDCDCCQDDQIQSVVDLLIYTLHNTSELDGSSAQDTANLRSTVLDFVVIIYESVARNKDFSQLLETDPSSIKEILLRLSQRLD